jgi:hypothetical protein
MKIITLDIQARTSLELAIKLFQFDRMYRRSQVENIGVIWPRRILQELWTLILGINLMATAFK